MSRKDATCIYSNIGKENPCCGSCSSGDVVVTTKRVPFHCWSSPAYGFSINIKETVNYTSSLRFLNKHDLIKNICHPHILKQIQGSIKLHVKSQNIFINRIFEIYDFKMDIQPWDAKRVWMDTKKQEEQSLRQSRVQPSLFVFLFFYSLSLFYKHNLIPLSLLSYTILTTFLFSFVSTPRNPSKPDRTLLFPSSSQLLPSFCLPTFCLYVTRLFIARMVGGLLKSNMPSLLAMGDWWLGVGCLWGALGMLNELGRSRLWIVQLEATWEKVN